MKLERLSRMPMATKPRKQCPDIEKHIGLKKKKKASDEIIVHKYRGKNTEVMLN